MTNHYCNQHGTRVLRAMLLHSSNWCTRAMSQAAATKPTQCALQLLSMPRCCGTAPIRFPLLLRSSLSSTTPPSGGSARNSTDCWYHHHGDYYSFHVQRRFVSTPTTALLQRMMDPENESMNMSHNHASRNQTNLDDELLNNDTTVTYDTIQRLLQRLRSENYEPISSSSCATLHRVDEYGTVTEIATRDWIHQQAQHDAALREWLVATPHGVRHLCDCLHYDFVWHATPPPPPPPNEEDGDLADSP
jgi:hypothetical protein